MGGVPNSIESIESNGGGRRAIAPQGGRYLGSRLRRILSAALKKDVLGPDGYQEMILNTTKLNAAGPDLAAAHLGLAGLTGHGL